MQKMVLSAKVEKEKIKPKFVQNYNIVMSGIDCSDKSVHHQTCMAGLPGGTGKNL